MDRLGQVIGAGGWKAIWLGNTERARWAICSHGEIQRVVLIIAFHPGPVPYLGAPVKSPGD